METNSYGSINVLKTYIPGAKNTTMKDEKRPLLDTESQSDSTEPPAGGETVLDLVRPLNNMASYKMELDDPVLNRSLEHPTSSLDTMFHLLKGNVGTGILAMPDGFRNAGWAMGTVGTLLVGIICTHCMHILIGCSHDLCRRTNVPALNFAQVSEYACQLGPEPLRKYSWLMKVIINTFLCITQIGFCCVYFVFVAANIQEVVKHYYMDIDVHWYLVLLLIPLIVLNWIKSLKYLAPVSMFASVLTCTGLSITFFYMLQGLPNISSIKAVTSWPQLALFFGTAIYAFEGIGVILPIENNMERPQDLGGWNGLLNTGMVIVGCLYTAVGFFGYLKYGEMARLGSVTLYLPPNDILAQSVRAMMAMAIFLSYGLQFYVPFSIIWPFVKEHLDGDNAKYFGEYITRTILVIITFALATAIPNLGAVISLVGAFSSSALALIFPPVFEILTFWPDRLGQYKWVLWKDILIIIFGFFGFVLGSYVSILNIMYPEE